MSNGLTNAGFLDLTTGWAPGPSMTLAVDEAARGAPGRAVLVGAGTITGGQTARVTTSTGGRAAVTAGQTVDVFAWICGRRGGADAAPTVTVSFRDALGAVIGAPVATDVRAPLLTRYGAARMGVPTSFYAARLRTTAPVGTAKASLEIEVSTPTTALCEVMLLKPFIGAATAPNADFSRWDPGLHLTEDLQLAAWPSPLRAFDVGQGAEPKPWAVEFDAGSGPPMARRSAIEPARRFNGRVRCDDVQRAVLEAFARTATRFWFVEPDTDRLCVAQFAGDGAPKLTETRAAIHVMDVGLWLETA